jgi:hypothetical protein
MSVITPSARPDFGAPVTEHTETGSISPWLRLGLMAGPVFLVASLVQAVLRPGFDITRNAVSELSLGYLGWIQDLNFAVAGMLSLAAAVGAGRVLRGRSGDVWIPRLLGIVGVGLAAASIFHPDPSNGFPQGTPAGASATSDWHGMLHMICGSAAFVALIVACFVFGRRFSRAGERGWARTARAAGILFAVALPFSGGHDGSVILFAGVTVGWLTVTASIVHEARSAASSGAVHDAAPMVS